MFNPNDALRNLAHDKDDEKLIETFYIVMKEFGYTLKELKEIPIPTFFELVRMLKKEADLNKEAMRKKR